jgi:hypothetical protein
MCPLLDRRLPMVAYPTARWTRWLVGGGFATRFVLFYGTNPVGQACSLPNSSLSRSKRDLRDLPQKLHHDLIEDFGMGLMWDMSCRIISSRFGQSAHQMWNEVERESYPDRPTQRVLAC